MLSHGFRTYLKTPPSTWKLDVLLKMPASELVGMCELLGIPPSGTRPVVADRIMRVGTLREALTAYAGDRDGAQQLAGEYTGKALKDMARVAGVWIAPNKLGQAIALINWRERCRKNGQKYLAAAMEATKDQPRQKTLGL